MCDYFSPYILAKKVFRVNSDSRYHPQGKPVIGQGLLEKEIIYDSTTPALRLTRRNSIQQDEEMQKSSSSQT